MEDTKKLEPKTGHEKSKAAGQHIVGCPDLETTPNKTEQPNTNAMIIKTIQGLISQVNDKLWEIPLETRDKRNLLIKVALEEIDLFQKTTLFELQKAFNG